MKNICNPVLPINEYIPDTEPHVFDNRIYLFGSHDKENGETFCMQDYVFWSAPVDDLGSWTNKGVNYSAKQDPLSNEKMKYMYAPDVVKGNDGRYYLYYSLAGEKGHGGYSNPISVAVCDTPDGRYEYLGYVRNKDGSPMYRHINFDPAVINDNGTIRLYFGSDLFWLRMIPFKRQRNKIIARTVNKPVESISDDYMGAFHAVLKDDMMTVEGEITRIDDKISGNEYKNHRFFEGSSIRKINDVYYFIYSSLNNHELCYATSLYPDRDFEYGGTIVSNGDIGYMGRKPKDRLNHTGTNHGSIEAINGQWYVFYHRLTHNSDYSRQVCAEKIRILPDGSIPQVEITSCGLNDGPLSPGRYSAVTCCNLTNGKMKHGSNSSKKSSEPCIASADDERFISQISNGTQITFKYLKLSSRNELTMVLKGGKGIFEIYLNNDIAGSISFEGSRRWQEVKTEFECKENTYALTFKYVGKETVCFKEYEVKEK